ncbi:hypothetical protein TRIUR3_20984 [Triticum urartu]|uniref:Uncharacterized protein n=2 Tax=Triticum TaxID=4564 RepID=A0A9R0RW98_TRITD|nr:hypothetical protein TRIUR3_20984 [Triticum urartu]VAH68015.1 unnamed protein product [Triticum turgidum subsp. durum]
MGYAKALEGNTQCCVHDLVSIEGTYDRYQAFARAGKDVNEPGASNNNDGDPSNIQSRLKEITSWSLQNNADDSDANELEKLEKLLTDALKNTRSKKFHCFSTTQRKCWRNEIAVRERVQAARTPVVLGDRRKEGLEQPYDVHAFGTRKALLLMPISSPAIGYERVVKAAACKVQQGNFNKRVVG